MVTSTDEVVITLQSWFQTNRLITHEAKSDAVILNKQPFIGPLKPIFKVGGEGGGWTKPSNTNLSLCTLALLLMISFPGPSIIIHVQSVIQSFSFKSKC